MVSRQGSQAWGEVVHVRWRQRVRAFRWPVGMGMASIRYLRRGREVPRGGLPTPTLSESPHRSQAEGHRRQDASQGVGPRYQRRYTARITGSRLDARRLIGLLSVDLNAASPAEVAVFDKTVGDGRRMAVGDEYVVHMPGPWNGPVRVVERTPHSFRLATLRGHMEAGEIEFRASDTEDGDIVFTIESWARSGDRLANVLYDRLRLSKEMQLHMWTHFCSRVGTIVGGQIVGDVAVYTGRAAGREDTGPWPQFVIRATSRVFSVPFGLAARVRGGRPLHPRGLVFDATLRLHGTSRSMGVEFLDTSRELRGVARFSRAAGVPSPLPDVLGLALRWEPRRPDARNDAGVGEEGNAELLLATTGRTLLGRRLLRPTMKWVPGFYGSLLPFEAGDRRVLLGAVSRDRRTIPADADTLARAVDEHPLSLDLVVATELGKWHRFGELTLTGPAKWEREGVEPLRFQPTRHAICGLRPVGLLQYVRGASYSAAQRVPARNRQVP